jgi:hypothetical protein
VRVGVRSARMVEHRSDGCDAGPACNEQYPRVVDALGKGEGAEWSLHIEGHTWCDRVKVLARRASGIDTDQKFQRTLCRLLWRACDGVGAAPLLPVTAHDNGLSGKKRGRVVRELEREQERPRGRG